jgi:hypothetical protein
VVSSREIHRILRKWAEDNGILHPIQPQNEGEGR